jgi:hypothetical protein
LSAGQASVIGVKENIETGGGARPKKVRAISIY